MRLSRTITWHTSWKHHREFPNIANITSSDNVAWSYFTVIKYAYTFILCGYSMSARLPCNIEWHMSWDTDQLCSAVRVLSRDAYLKVYLIGVNLVSTTLWHPDMHRSCTALLFKVRASPTRPVKFFIVHFVEKASMRFRHQVVINCIKRRYFSDHRDVRQSHGND